MTRFRSVCLLVPKISFRLIIKCGFPIRTVSKPCSQKDAAAVREIELIVFFSFSKRYGTNMQMIFVGLLFGRIQGIIQVSGLGQKKI